MNMIYSENKGVISNVKPDKAETVSIKERNRINSKWLKSRANFRSRQARTPPEIPPFSIYKDFTYPDWYKTYDRNKIRARDKLTCQYCKKKGTNRNLHVHHINYQKYDCKELNLITLCRKCHQSTNYERHWWYAYFWRRINLIE